MLRWLSIRHYSRLYDWTSTFARTAPWQCGVMRHPENNGDDCKLKGGNNFSEIGVLFSKKRGSNFSGGNFATLLQGEIDAPGCAPTHSEHECGSRTRGKALLTALIEQKHILCGRTNDKLWRQTENNRAIDQTLLARWRHRNAYSLSWRPNGVRTLIPTFTPSPDSKALDPDWLHLIISSAHSDDDSYLRFSNQCLNCFRRKPP